MPVIKTQEKITWKGKILTHKNLTWSQEFNAGMPEAVSVTAGSATWSASFDLIDPESQRPPSPWEGKCPVPGDSIIISTSLDDQNQEFQGIVDDVTYTNDCASISVVTPVDKFNAGKVRLPPLLATMPRTDNFWGATQYGSRYPAPSVLWAVNEAFCTAGYYTTPPRHPSTVIDLNMQGAFWANSWRRLGEVLDVRSYSGASGRLGPAYGTGAGKIWFHDGQLTASATRDLAGVRLSFLSATDHTGNATITIVAGETGTISVRVDSNRDLVAFDNVNGGSELGRIDAADWAGTEPVSFCVVDNTWSLGTSSKTITGRTGYDSKFTGIQIRAEYGAKIAGVQVDKITSIGHRILNFKQTANLEFGHWTNTTPYFPSIRDEKPRDVLDAICQATLSSWWLDPTGSAHFESAEAILSKPVSAEVNALEHIGDYAFEDAFSQRRSAVVVKYSEPAISLSSRWGIDLWAKGGSGDAGDSTEDFVGPDDGMDWIDPDLSFSNLNADPAAFNSRNGSWYGASKENPNDMDRTVACGGYQFKAQTIVPWRFKLTDSFTEKGSRSVPNQLSFAADLRTTNTPVLRGRGLVETETVEVEVAGGHALASTLEIDATPWVTRDVYAKSIATWVSQQVFSPLPVLKSLTVRYTNQIEISQMIRVYGVMRDGTGNLFGAILRCSVIGVSCDPDGGTTNLTLRIVAEEYRTRTWAQVEENVAAQNMVWSELEKTRQENQTHWSDVESNPTAYTGG